MFSAVPMKKVRVLVLDDYLDKVRGVLGKLSSVHIVKPDYKDEKDMQLVPRGNILDRYSDLVNRIAYLVDVLEIPKSKEIGTVIIPEKSSEEYLIELENDIGEIEKKVIPSVDKLDRILQERTTLKVDELARECMDKLDIDANWLGTSDFLHVTAGFLDHGSMSPEDITKDMERLDTLMKKATKGNYMILKESLQDKIMLVLITLKEYQAGIEELVCGFNIDILKLDEETNLEVVRERLKEIEGIEGKLRSGLGEIRSTKLKDILIAREISRIEKNGQELVLKFGNAGRIYALEGWVPDKEVGTVTRELERVSQGCVILRAHEPEPDEDVPVSLQNPKIIKPFESILGMFGLPKYTEIDPTPILAITFPLIFGMMFGDVGHGGVMVLVGLGLFHFKKDDETSRNYGVIIAYCGIAAILFGFMYGSIFGNEEILPAIWVSPLHDIFNMMGVAMFIGVIHMTIGMILGAINKMRESGPNTLIHSVGTLGFLYGEVTLITMIFQFPIPIFMDVGKTYPFPSILLCGIVIPVLLIITGELVHKGGPFDLKKLLGVFGGGLFEVFEIFSMFLSNTISYSRILILAVVHAMMMMSVFMIADIAKALTGVLGTPLSLLILIGGNIAVMALEGLIVFIHTIRLHFYEWFTKFYEGGGTEYEPFGPDREYTQVEST